MEINQTAESQKEVDVFEFFVSKYKNFHQIVTTMIASLEKYSDPFVAIYTHVLQLVGVKGQQGLDLFITSKPETTAGFFAGELKKYSQKLTDVKRSLVSQWANDLKLQPKDYIEAYQHLSHVLFGQVDETIMIWAERLKPEEVELGIKLFRYFDLFLDIVKTM